MLGPLPSSAFYSVLCCGLVTRRNVCLWREVKWRHSFQDTDMSMAMVLLSHNEDPAVICRPQFLRTVCLGTAQPEWLEGSPVILWLLFPLGHLPGYKKWCLRVTKRTLVPLYLPQFLGTMCPTLFLQGAQFPNKFTVGFSLQSDFPHHPL